MPIGLIPYFLKKLLDPKLRVAPSSESVTASPRKYPYTSLLGISEVATNIL